MPIPINDAPMPTWILITALLALCWGSARQVKPGALLPPSVSQELKGVAILAVLFSHIGLFLVSDHRFLFPLSIAAGVGVNIFLFLSGFGLTTGMLNRKMPVLAFYRRRLTKVFIPFWIALTAFFVLDTSVLSRTYSLQYIVQSAVGFFPRADVTDDVNSPFWYITWILMYYLLLPLGFSTRRPWLSAIALFAIGEAIVAWNPPAIGLVTRLYVVHTAAFPLGMIAAWLLYVPKGGQNPLVERLQALRDGLSAPAYYTGCALLSAVVGYFAYYSGIGEGPWKEQIISLITMTALTLLFMLKRVELGFISLIGLYSYEIYLLHWPLLARYDMLYHKLPAWLATGLYLAIFLALGRAVQKATEPLDALFEKPAKAMA